MENNTKVINSLSSYIDQTRKLYYKLVAEHEIAAAPNIYFRGQTDSSWPITPSVFRNKKADEYELLMYAKYSGWPWLKDC